LEEEAMHLENFLVNIQSRFSDFFHEDAREKISTKQIVIFSRDRDKKSLETLRRLVQNYFCSKLSRGGFWERLATKKLRETLESMACSLIGTIVGPLMFGSDLLKILGVSAILIIDSTSSSLPKKAKDIFPAPRKNVTPAAVKLHLCFDLLKGAVNWFNITEGTSHDRNSFPDVSSLRNKLIIFDLGYWDYTLFAAIKAAGGFFLTRIKSSASIKIIEVVDGLPKHFEGWYLFDRKLPDKKSDLIEVVGRLSMNSKMYLDVRIIGFFNPTTMKYHWYITNLLAPAEMIYSLYRLRWQIELIFKSMKATFRLADFSTSNPNIIMTLVLSSLISAMLSYPIALALALDNKQNKKSLPSFQRAAIVISICSSYFVKYISGNGDNKSLQCLIQTLRSQAQELFDPNFKRRKTSLDTAEEMVRDYL